MINTMFIIQHFTFS